jgi:hypothetical protein
MSGKRLNPAELKIDLLCRGMLIDGKCRIRQDGRPVCSNPLDLASGLEIVLPGDMSDLWVNVPIREKSVEQTPYHLRHAQGAYYLFDERNAQTYAVRLAPKPDWYGRTTTSGIPMSQIGMLQGTVLFIEIGDSDRFWSVNRVAEGGSGQTLPRGAGRRVTASIEDIVETAAAAQKRSGITLVILRGSFQNDGGFARIFPYINALKREVGILAGVQSPPETDLKLYDQACALGVDHISFYFEFFGGDVLHRYAPNKAEHQGRERLMKALEYCVHLMGKGRVSGELIAGVEPIGDTMRGIDYFAGMGALPLISIFRPLRGTAIENSAAPDCAEMLSVFRHVYWACRAHNLPIGMTPNVHLSLQPHPADTLYLAADLLDVRAYQRWIFTMQQVMRPYFLRRMRKNATPQSQ